MKIAFRTDAWPGIGVGHMMRCMTLAMAFDKSGADVCFVSRNAPSELAIRLNSAGIKLIGLPDASGPEGTPELPDKGKWLNIDDEADAAQTKLALREEGEVDWLIVDSYSIGWEWESEIRPYVKALMSIDDIGRRHESDLLLDQNYCKNFEKRYDKIVPVHCRKLLGPRYALLRPEFSEAWHRSVERDGNVERILVSFGGTDRTNETGKALSAIAMLKRNDIYVDVVVGSANPNKEKIRRLCDSLPRAAFYVDAEDMAGLMGKAHLSIGACGTTTWERCCVGLPSVIMALAANQTEIARSLGEKGIAANLGWHEDVTANDIKERLRGLLKNPRRLRAMSERSKELVDGQGVGRVAEEILADRVFGMGISVSTSKSAEKGLEVENATSTDMMKLFEWRNHPDVRKNFFNPEPLRLDEHEKWFKERISNPEASIYIASWGDEKIGTVRFEPKGCEIRVSVMLSPPYIGRGFGAEVIRLCTEKFIKERRPSLPIVAEIKKENLRSIKAFEGAGYRKSYSTYVFAAGSRECE